MLLPFYNPLVKKDIVIYLKLLDQIQDYFRQPYPLIVDVLRRNPINERIPRYAVITDLLLPDVWPLLIRMFSHQAKAVVCRTGLALNLFRQKHGVYPENIEELAPEFIDAVPEDPFTGKALVYRRDGEGFILYSLGPNQYNDGGVSLPAGVSLTETPHDIAWKSEN